MEAGAGTQEMILRCLNAATPCLLETQTLPAAGTPSDMFTRRNRGNHRRPVGRLALLALLGASWVGAQELPAVVHVPAGSFLRSSDGNEREFAYRIDAAAYGHSVTREQRWYEQESSRQVARTAAFAISRTPITNAQYESFVAATGHRMPAVDAATWQSFGLQHPYAATRRFAWRHGRAAAKRRQHPVVLVSRSDAEAYARWLSAVTGKVWRLPTELEWEKAVRGVDGHRFPWGDAFDPLRLNSADSGPFDTVAVGAYPQGASPYGLLDGAGQVYEWTATPAGPGQAMVKGGSWDDRGCGVCRPAARHGRPTDLKHILIGFRLVREEQ